MTVPSRDEGFGLVFVEAMRAGKACIAGRDAAAEIVEHDATGLVVDPAKDGEVLAAVVRLFREPETCHRMGMAGYTRFTKHFTAEIFHQRLREVIGQHVPAGICVA